MRRLFKAIAAMLLLGAFVIAGTAQAAPPQYQRGTGHYYPGHQVHSGQVRTPNHYCPPHVHRPPRYNPPRYTPSPWSGYPYYTYPQYRYPQYYFGGGTSFYVGPNGMSFYFGTPVPRHYGYCYPGCGCIH